MTLPVDLVVAARGARGPFAKLTSSFDKAGLPVAMSTTVRRMSRYSDPPSAGPVRSEMFVVLVESTLPSVVLVIVTTTRL